MHYIKINKVFDKESEKENKKWEIIEKILEEIVQSFLILVFNLFNCILVLQSNNNDPIIRIRFRLD